jgi:alkanesulfonate monooxygenase SsuD/methylene tetrahydromethanopterin reductase-like flavin-dependent oxidoreductase (luciferase family)
VQQPHPPIWIPGGGGSIETWDFCARHNYQYCYLSFYGHRFAQAMFEGFWSRRDELGLDRNPYRAGFTQLICVSETDAKAKEEYESYVNNFWDIYLHVSPKFREAPGYRTAASVARGMRTQYGSEAEGAKLRIGLNWEQLVEQGFVIAGSPASVRDQLKEAIKKLRIGNLIPQLAFADMPKWLASKNIELFAREVMPYLRDIWDDEYPVTNWPEVQHNKLNKTSVSQV